jgi:hypothetical protein
VNNGIEWKCIDGLLGKKYVECIKGWRSDDEWNKNEYWIKGKWKSKWKCGMNDICEVL